VRGAIYNPAPRGLALRGDWCFRLFPFDSSDPHPVAVARFLYPALLTATLALAAALCLGPGTANRLLSVVGVVRAQSPGGPGPVAGVGDGSQYTPGFNTGPVDPYNHIMTSAPTQPMPVSQPQNWAAGARAANSNAGIQSVYVPPAGASPAQPVESAMKVGQVGDEVILASDLGGRYGAYLTDKANGAPPDQLAYERQDLISQLKNLVDVKLLFIEATKTIPEAPLKDFQKQINESFDKSQVKDMMERVKVNTPAELDAILRQMGSSLERKRQSFFEQTMANEWLREQSEKDKEVDFDTAVVYYKEHPAEFSFPAQVRWEQLTASFSQFNDKALAGQTVAAMGNDVLHGIPFAEVAKKHSQGPTADKGGLRDWTTKGALVSKVLDGALFSPLLQPNQMSVILEDSDGYHIIRIIERRDAGKVSFLDAQAGIKKKLKEERIKKTKAEYLDKLRNKTPIWTIFDEGPGAKGQGPGAKS
jgi:parvulin-like peptidyl-prolyl isomerase